MHNFKILEKGRRLCQDTFHKKYGSLHKILRQLNEGIKMSNGDLSRRAAIFARSETRTARFDNKRELASQAADAFGHPQANTTEPMFANTDGEASREDIAAYTKRL